MDGTLVLLFILVFPGVAEPDVPLTNLETIAGKLVFYQTDGNATYLRDTGELASDIPTETMFQLSDPQQNFSTANFSYTWDLGNGEVIQGTEPVVRYHYALSGNYTFRLKIRVNITEYTPPLTGIYSKDIQVLDAVKSIKLTGPFDYEVSQTTGLAFHMDGSPPMWVCWRFVANCVPDTTGSCTLTMLYGNTLWLNHTFTTAGVHCLDISVRNDISKLQTSFNLFVRKNNNTNILFILSSAAIFVATFTFITVIACHPRYQNKAQMATPSNALFLKGHTDGQIVLNLFPAQREERQPLWVQDYTPYYS
ncbi:transmembrane protein 130 [Syngnathus scovelli]|uniref:transmembrane protein 130 n=1 Tax=Syngnathus scovelli TaxID=161590 RepID=UPI00211076CC|nr:transmembrane protein 130 [Syngnathus scovelli]